jgi:hypothetical protein
VSLYGTGRREGIGSVLVLAAVVVLVLALGSVQLFGASTSLPAVARDAIVPVLGGTLFYRFLRSLRRSRYVSFLTAVAYALSPWLLAMALAPREQLAAALAPLALEAVSRCDRPSQRRAWLPWTGICLALPFVPGVTTIAVLVTLLCGCLLVRLITCGDRSDATPPAFGIVAAVALACITAVSVITLDPLAPWLHREQLGPLEVLHAHHAGSHGLDVAAVLRVPGPVLLFFALLGVLRRQRHVSIGNWLVVAAAGAVPTMLLVLVPPGAFGFAFWHQLAQLPATAWWLTLLAIGVLAAAGLDDFLDLPLRRRTALPWLLALAVLLAPVIPFVSTAPDLEWPLTATLLLLAVLMPLWRRMGILQWKNLLAVAVVLVLAVPALQVLPVLMPPPIGAAPLGEVSRWLHTAMLRATDAPSWPYAGFAFVLLASGVWWLLAFWRRIQANTAPQKARAAITRKARPLQRS